MKGMGGLFLMIMVVVGGIYVWMQMGGSVSGSAPPVNGRPEVDVPSANESASSIQRFFNTFADWVTSLSSTVWQIVAILIVVGVCRYVFKRVPIIVWLAFGVIIGIVVISVW